MVIRVGVTSVQHDRELVGVDACAAGWIAVRIAPAPIAAALYATFDELVVTLSPSALVGVDIPIGLVARGWRDADLAVRQFLTRRRSSLFVMPPRSVVNAKSYAIACERAERLVGQRISQQAFNLFAKLREVDRHVADERFVEVHPETSFAVMANEPGLAHGKKTWAGATRRRALLAAEGIVLPDSFGSPADDVAVDDVLDAAAAAWSARRHALGIARQFSGDSDQRDRSGRRIAIVA